MYKEICKILKTNRVNFITNKELADELTEDNLYPSAFEVLIPDCFGSYDGKSITETKDYVDILQYHLQISGITLDAKAIGCVQKGSGIILEFPFKGGRQAIKFKGDDSRWVADDFYKKLNSFTKKLLGSECHLLETDTDICCFIQLPKKAIKQLRQKVFFDLITIDDICNQMRKGETAYIQWYKIPPKITRQLNKEGESIGTMIIKENIHLDDYSADDCPPEVLGVYDHLINACQDKDIIDIKNKDGKNFIDIAKEMNHNLVLDYWLFPKKHNAPYMEANWLPFNAFIEREIIFLNWKTIHLNRFINLDPRNKNLLTSLSSKLLDEK